MTNRQRRSRIAVACPLLVCGAFFGLQPLVTPAEDVPQLPRFPAVEPEAARTTLHVAHGHSVSLMASEPLVASPVAMAWDERGRLYVVEMRGYSELRDERLSRVRLLVDDNADHVFDRATIFVDGLLWPTAVACWDGGVFVGDAPDIWYFKDTDGDGVADLRRQVLTGFGSQNVQGLLNSFHWHLDQRIHGSSSTNGGDVRAVNAAGEPFGPSIAVRGRDFSFDPRSLLAASAPEAPTAAAGAVAGAADPSRTLTVDVRAESGGGQHGMSFDDWGHKFVSANSDHAQQILIEDRYLNRNPAAAISTVRVSIAADGPQADVFRQSPIEPWRAVRTKWRVQGVTAGIVEGGGRAAGYFTGATGATVIRGSAFAEPERGALVVGDVGGNLVHRKRLTGSGTPFVAERIDVRSEWVASTDTWFRPAQYANAPDGGLWIIDVYREVIEHPHSLPAPLKQQLDLNSGRDRGRLWRVAPTGAPRLTIPAWNQLSAAELAGFLAHPNAWHRETAARWIHERQPPGILPAVEALVTATTTSDLGRVHGIAILASTGRLSIDVIRSAIRSASPRVRELAVRFSERLPGDQRLLLGVDFAGLVSDPDALVRLQLALTLGEWPVATRAPLLAELLRTAGQDRWIRTACLTSLSGCADQVLLTLLTPPPAGLPLEKGWQPETLASLAQLVGRTGTPTSITAILAALTAAPASPSPALPSPGAALPSPVEGTVRIPGASTVTLGLLLALQTGAAQRGAKLTDGLSPEFAAQVTALLDAGLKQATLVAGDRQQPIAARVVAFQAVASIAASQAEPLVQQGLHATEPIEIRRAALALWERQGPQLPATAVLQHWISFTPELRRTTIEAFLGRPQRCQQLLAAIEAQQLAPTDLDRTQIERLKKHADPAIRERAAALLKHAGSEARQPIVDRYRPALALAGQAQRGKQHFGKHCAACHKLEGIGNEVGPSLAAMKNRGGEAFLLNVFDPNREVNPQFVAYVVVTTSGRAVSGLVASETANGLVLRLADGRAEVIPRDEIEELRSTGLSLMPEGLEKQLDGQSFADLWAYLESLE